MWAVFQNEDEAEDKLNIFKHQVKIFFKSKIRFIIPAAFFIIFFLLTLLIIILSSSSVSQSAKFSMSSTTSPNNSVTTMNTTTSPSTTISTTTFTSSTTPTTKFTPIVITLTTTTTTTTSSITTTTNTTSSTTTSSTTTNSTTTFPTFNTSNSVSNTSSTNTTEASIPSSKGVSSRCTSPWTLLSTGCYLFLADEPRTWFESKTKCEEMGAYLVELNSVEENKAVTAEIEQQGWRWNKVEFWLGLTDLEVEGIWRWNYSGNAMEGGFMNWPHGVPTPTHHEDCVHMSSYGVNDYVWNDLPCGVATLAGYAPGYTWNALCEQ